MLGYTHLLNTVPCFVTDPRVAYVASVSVRFRSKEQGTRLKDLAKNGAKNGFLVLVPFFAQPKPKISFLGVSLLWNQTETLATQANPWEQQFFSFQFYHFFILKKNQFSSAAYVKWSHKIGKWAVNQFAELLRRIWTVNYCSGLATDAITITQYNFNVVKAESTRKLSNFNFQWTKTL